MGSHVDLLRIAAQIERWARFDDVVAPGLDDAEELRGAAAENQRLREDMEIIAGPRTLSIEKAKRIARDSLEALAGDADEMIHGLRPGDDLGP